jgi:hypothetical protein
MKHSLGVQALGLIGILFFWAAGCGYLLAFVRLLMWLTIFWPTVLFLIGCGFCYGCYKLALHQGTITDD